MQIEHNSKETQNSESLTSFETISASASGIMEPEDFLDPLEPSESINAKRLPDFVGREAKRLCTQSNRLPPESTELSFSNEFNPCGESSVPLSSEFGHSSLQYNIDPTIDWSYTVPPWIFGGLNSTANAQGSGTESFLFDAIPGQMWDMNTHSIPGVDEIYQQREIIGSANVFDSHYAFDANQTVPPHLQLTYEQNISYHNDLSKSRILPYPCNSSFTELSVGGTSACIDVNPNPENETGYQTLDAFVPPELEAAGIAPQDEGEIITSPKQENSVADQDTSEYSSISMEHDKNSTGKVTQEAIRP